MLRFKLVRLLVSFAALTGAVFLIWFFLAFVTSTPSLAQDSPEGGVVGTGTAASCTQAALNARLSGGGTITFNCGPNPVTITVTAYKLITADTTINGGGKITLSGGGTNKILWLSSGIRLSLKNITISKGNDFVGGCITLPTNSTLLATQTTIQNCQSSGPGNFGSGGAIYAANATIVMTDSSILNNLADTNGGGLFLSGGTTTFNRVSVINNSAHITYTSSGGGLYILNNAKVTINNSVISSNHIGYTAKGGGIASFNSTLKLHNTEVNNNHADNAASGGGLYLSGGTVLISGGDIGGNYGLYNGGGLAIENAQADLTGVTLSANVASSNGGGLYAFQSTVNLTDVVLSHNTVGSDGGGLHCYTCTSTFTRVMIDGNSAESRDGGGMLAYQSNMSIINSTIQNNTSTDGGGIYNSDSTMFLSGVTINGNTATSTGGGFYNEGIADFSNATISGNTAATGGGLNNTPFADPATATLVNVTIKDNGATDGGGLFNFPDPKASVTFKNTVIADSRSGGNCKGKNIASAKYSISSDNTCILSGTGNHTNIDPQLTALADNGGPTMTNLPLSSSPAVNGVVGSDCPSLDQRGVSRPQGASCDIGAVERTASDPLYPRQAFLPMLRK